MNEPTPETRAAGRPIAGGESEPLPDWLRLTARHVAETRYGQVTLTIHQGEVIEVQKTERTRLSHPRRAP